MNHQAKPGKERGLTQSLVLSDFVQHLALREAFGRQLFSVAHPVLQSAQAGRHVVQSLVQLTLNLLQREEGRVSSALVPVRSCSHALKSEGRNGCCEKNDMFLCV